jgi:hypothetical protein
MAKHKIYLYSLLFLICISIAGCKNDNVKFLIVGSEPIPFGYYFTNSSQIPYNWVSIDSKTYETEGDFFFKVLNDSSKMTSHPLVFVNINDGYVSEVQVLVQGGNFHKAVIGCEGRRYLLSSFNFSIEPENNFYNDFFISKLDKTVDDSYKIVEKNISNN